MSNTKPLKRTTKFYQDYVNWKLTRANKTISFIKQTIDQNKFATTPVTNSPIIWQEFPELSIFHMSACQHIPPEDLPFLHELFREKIETHIPQYILMQADTRITKISSQNYKIDRYHFKADYRQPDPIWNQLWGTITLELYNLLPDIPQFLQIRCARVKDRLLTDARPFKDLLELLFTSSKH